ncbi:zinc-binding dehydrogenase [Geomesophilobacter sediminis]|uniref:Zinc-binding dehydrogenase n=1 Tax=Geomesophilobacter sediminis TaxID=2798584 RepID=A0A8J7M0H1_9BACT|nr:zinc-binding dehydrogenase [Geomesophilobacter sediminis]MBJ6725157.1 zinc-binding dehydrogenase [Geomesophilobacter sediminis]
MTGIPGTMKAVLLSGYDGRRESMTVAEVPVPRPGPGQVLVRMDAAPVNPSDLMFIRGLYGFQKPLPAIPGFEGSGVVVAAGSGVLPRLLLGRRVACAAADPDSAGGTWGEYLAISALRCIRLHRNVELEQGANLLINPLTAWGLLEKVRRGGHGALVQTAAASAVGRMVVKLGIRFSVPTINVVRREEQVELLRREGAEHVLNSAAPEFDEKLAELCHRWAATIGFDAVAGEMSGRVLGAQPAGSTLFVYGALSMEPSRVDPAALIFERKRLEGFWLSVWFGYKSPAEQLRIAGKAQRLLGSDLKTEIRDRIELEELPDALERFAASATGGKVMVLPGRK